MTDRTPPRPGPPTPPPGPRASGGWAPGSPPSPPTASIRFPPTAPGWTGNAPGGAGALVERRPKAIVGGALLLAGRVVAIAILAVVSSSLGLLVSLGLYAVADRVTDTWRFDASLGSGPMVVLLSAAVGIVGSIVALAQRTPRKMPPAA